MLGLGAAVPLGPINILIINYALKRYILALCIGFGAMSADLTYLIFLYNGLLMIEPSQEILWYLSFFGAIFMFMLSYLTYKHASDHIKKISISLKKGMLQTYLKGYILTFLNPYTLGFWTTVSSLLVIKGDFFSLILGLFSSICLWVVLMPYFVYKSRNLLNETLSLYLSYFSSAIFFLFGCMFVYKVVS